MWSYSSNTQIKTRGAVCQGFSSCIDQDHLKRQTHAAEPFLCISVWNGTWLWRWHWQLKLVLFFVCQKTVWVQGKVWGSTSQPCIISVEAAACFSMKNRYIEICVNLLYTWERHELLSSFLKPALITGYRFSSEQWQLTSWCGFWQRMVLMLGTDSSPPGDVFTVTSAWLTRSNNRWMFNHSLFRLSTLVLKRPFLFFFLEEVLKRVCFYVQPQT